MTSRACIRLALLVAGLTFAGAGCLPGDERPLPARIDVVTEPSPMTQQGLTTSDGWTVTFDRFVLAVGDARLDDDSCNAYTESHYERLFDFTVAKREKVALMYGLGRCGFRYRARSPSEETIVSSGASEADRIAMRLEGSDAYASNQRIALIARGRASRGDRVKRFDWSFRHSYQVRQCTRRSGDGEISELDLKSGDQLTVSIEVRGEELFRLAPVDGLPLHFDSYAEADTDADGWITLEELDQVDSGNGEPAGVGGGGGAAGFGGAGGAPGLGSGTPLRLGEVVYELLLPRVTRLAGGGPCDYEEWEPHH